MLAAASTTFWCRYFNRYFNTFIPNRTNLYGLAYYSVLIPLPRWLIGLAELKWYKKTCEVQSYIFERSELDSVGGGCPIFYLELTGSAALIRKGLSNATPPSTAATPAQILIICRADGPHSRLLDFLSSKRPGPSSRWAVRVNGSEHMFYTKITLLIYANIYISVN